jgi:hypothetical protein
MKCNGKCHLVKEFRNVEEDNSDWNNPDNTKTELPIIYFFEKNLESVFGLFIFKENSNLVNYMNNYFYDHCSSFFRPPCQV